MSPGPFERKALLFELSFGLLPATAMALFAVPITVLSLPLLIPVLAGGIEGFLFSAPILTAALLGPPVLAVVWVAGIARFRGRTLAAAWPTVRLALIVGAVLPLLLLIALRAYMTPFTAYSLLAPVAVTLHLLVVFPRAQASARESVPSQTPG